MSSSSQQGLWKSSLDSRLDSYFGPLCTSIDTVELASLKISIDRHVEEIKQALQHNEFLDIDMAEHIAVTLLSLLNDLDKYPEYQRNLIAGAARYFVHQNDAEPDTGSVLGLDDDVTVLNYVLGAIGKPELKVQI
jgi:uncharacterized membrane protein YkvA (DUF1232 family)